MDSIKWKCKNWIGYFKKFDNFHLIHLIVKEVGRIELSSNILLLLSLVAIVITLKCDIWTRFLKNIHQKLEYYREENQDFETLLIFLHIKCRQNWTKLNSVRSLWPCGEKNRPSGMFQLCFQISIKTTLTGGHSTSLQLSIQRLVVCLMTLQWRRVSSWVGGIS